MNTCKTSIFLLIIMSMDFYGHVSGGKGDVWRRLKELEKKVGEMQVKHMRSAFSAYMTVGVFRPQSDFPVTVPFNGVDFNLNRDYNSQHSVYTCPVDGVYFFTYNLYSSALSSEARDMSAAALFMDNKWINSALCGTETKEIVKCAATNSVVLHCKKGGKVLVATFATVIQIFGTSQHDRTTFTGFLLYSM